MHRVPRPPTAGDASLALDALAYSRVVEHLEESMNGRVVKDFRRQASKVANQTVSALQPGITAALTNEQLTRQRVDALEAKMRVTQEAVDALEAWQRRGWRARWRWLLRGLDLCDIMGGEGR